MSKLEKAVFYGIVDLGYVAEEKITEVCEALIRLESCYHFAETQGFLLS